ncbi:uncharacterized protein F5147DRAFT_265352 [Suillus discolor]|uniref:DUF6533 domain-containing protein n=1 Tax=Suillus discolor TaxID=1912936 RepID=A0A9P7F2D2_9AGAM|nr:uncharacterized protein F5147DRAFT_265352 [Suillus discolor]KAG2104359.1 hypothetical protein F5147DRAFT_265352 [Suillus discolor]
MHVLYTLHVVLSHTAVQQTSKYLRVAPAAIWILDYFLTFEHEVRLFSNISCWNIVPVMFILARYVPVLWIITEIYLVCQSLLAHIQQKRYELSVNFIQRNDVNAKQHSA